MRQVNKGFSPRKFKKYKEAEPFLEERIGRYCSYCEMKLDNVPAVEHKVSKSEGGDELAWSNLLLSCFYCNSHKGHRVTAINKDEFLWPDEDDTYHVFSYKQMMPILDEKYLRTQSQEIRQKAENTYHLFRFDIDCKSWMRDRRIICRNEARNLAIKYLKSLNEHVDDRAEYIACIVDLAKGYGFFSTWMAVFYNEKDVKEALVYAFPGTDIVSY